MKCPNCSNVGRYLGFFTAEIDLAEYVCSELEEDGELLHSSKPILQLGVECINCHCKGPKIMFNPGETILPLKRDKGGWYIKHITDFRGHEIQIKVYIRDPELLKNFLLVKKGDTK